MKQLHVSMLGLGITAVVGVAAIIYYKNAQATAADANGSAGALSPLFQTAAIPSTTPAGGSGGGSGVATPGTPTDTGFSASDLFKLASQQIMASLSTAQGQENTNLAAIAGNNVATIAPINNSLFSQIISQLPGVTVGGQNYVQATVEQATPWGNLATTVRGIYGSQVEQPAYYAPAGFAPPAFGGQPIISAAPATPQAPAPRPSMFDQSGNFTGLGMNPASLNAGQTTGSGE